MSEIPANTCRLAFCMFHDSFEEMEQERKSLFECWFVAAGTLYSNYLLFIGIREHNKIY